MSIDAKLTGTIGDFELNVSFSVPSVGITALFGPSGCGKTTVLRCVAGLNSLPGSQLAVSGEIWQDRQRSLPTHKRPVGYVFQEANLFNHLSVLDNLLYGFKRSQKQELAPQLDEIVALLGLDNLLNRSPRSLSGGEQQRVAIGRALMSAPQILLMDEPLAALDRASKNDILPYLEKLHSKLDIPVLYVSHDISEVERLADHMVLMERGQVTKSGHLETLLSDPTLPLASMPDAAVVMKAEVKAFDEQYGLTTVQVAGGELISTGYIGPKGSEHRLRIIASDVGLCRNRAPDGSSILNGPKAKITYVDSSLPYQMTVFLNLGEHGKGAGLLARISKKSWDKLQLAKGDVVHALIKGVNLLK
jgi:molybdate transport system ATP-binding protein